ncbi:hypothetical protein [Mycobacterium sp. 1245805.9]|uniref:hypothetical protein n=1 Tax=Mycobacterium sp. 1245805.9 TaxID=1856862 RepID=UPI0012E9E826|nr:hypothetical protein [Mycobacterium sp. 1245805.9]
MVPDDTHRRLLEREKHERMEQIEAILRRLNPELTDDQLEDLMRQLRERSGLADV